MYVAHGVVALEVAGQMIAVAQVKDGYIWTTEYTNGKESDVLSALKRATQQAVRESRFGGFRRSGNYIGDSYGDTQEVIESCLKDIPELRKVD